MAERDGVSGLFGFTGGDEGYEALKRRRAIAAALAARQRGFPKTLGEGLTYFGESLGEAIADWRLRQMEAKSTAANAGLRTPAPDDTKPPTYTEPTDPPTTPTTPGQAATDFSPAVDPGEGTPVSVAEVPPPPAASVFPDPPPPPVAAVEPPPNVMPGARPVQTSSFRPPPAPADLVTPEPPPESEPYLPPAPPPSALNARAAGLVAPQQGPLDPEPFDQRNLVTPGGPPDPAVALAPKPGDWQPTVPQTADMRMPRPRPSGDLPAQAAMTPRGAPGGNVQSWYDFAVRPREEGGLGLNHAQAAAKVANLQAESGPGIKPWGVSGDAGTAFGAAQWRGPRFAALQQFARERGIDHRTTEAQQAFMRHEYDTTEKRAYQKLLAAQTPESAATAINRYYERSADTTGRREQNAARLAGMLGPGGGAPSVATAAPPEADPAQTRITVNARPPEAGLPDQRDIIAAALMEQPQPPPGGVQQAQASPEDIQSEALLRESMGMRRPGSPFKATAARGDIATDGPAVGLSPLGSATGAGIGDSVQQRQRIYDAVQQQQQAPVVPPADPTLAATTSPQSTPNGTGSDPVRLAQAMQQGIRPDMAPQWYQPPPPAAAPPPPAPATVTDIKPAPDMPPSRDAIPPASQEAPIVVPPERPRPPLLAPNEREQHWLNVARDRRADEQTKAYAADMAARHAKWREQLQAQQQEEYKNHREKREKLIEARDKQIREAPARDIDQLTKRLAIENQQAAAAKSPYELQQAQLAVQETELKIAQARRNLEKPDTFSSGGAQFERPYDASGKPSGPYTLAPGSPPPKEEPMTADQASAQQFVTRVRPDLITLDKELKHGAVLANPVEVARSYGGPLAMSEEYKRANGIMTNFRGAFMQRTSGAAVSEGEAKRNLPAFEVEVGDSPEILAEKAERRNRFVDAVEASAGKAGAAAIHRVLAESSEYLYQKAGAKPPVKVSTPEEADALEPGTRIIRPDGQPGRVPRKRL